MFHPNIHHLQTVLCLGCHADDIEIGCGGTLLKWLAMQPGLKVHWVVLSAAGERADEALSSAAAFLGQPDRHDVRIADFNDRYFPYEGAAIKRYLHDLANDIDPDLVFTHRREDLHQDHNSVAKLTWQAFRHHLIFEYEIPKYEGDLGHPNVLSPLSDEIANRKITLLRESFPSQHSKPWYDEETFRAMMRIRGLECHAGSGYAEGFTCRKMVL